MRKRLKSILSLVVPMMLLLAIVSSTNVLAMSSEPVEEPGDYKEPVANEDGLIAHYTFNESLVDELDNFGEAKIVGKRIDAKRGGSITYGEGMRDQAAIFDGKSGLRLSKGLITDNSYSVSFWLKPEEITAFTTTFFAGSVDESDKQKWISFVPSGPGEETMLWSGNDPWYDGSTYMKIAKQEWVHVAFTVDNGKLNIYLNGQERFSDAGFPDIFTDEDSVFALGVNYWDTPFKGMIDDLRIYNQAISADKVKELADGAKEIVIKGPQFRNVAVHDPMMVKENGTYYVFGSHLGVAKSKDLMKWEAVGNGWSNSNPVVPNVEKEFKEALEWPEPDAETTWAKSILKLNGKYYMYFSTAHWESPRSAIALAIADDIEGPYKYQGMLIKKYENGEYSEEAGEKYDNSILPGVIDPHVFFDADGKLWMDYGSYSGGMYILEMDPKTGYPKPGQGYGKRLAGGNHMPMEGPQIQYSEETGYYYLFVSFGTLASDGGYNIRVMRSKNPDGPYTDPQGNDMVDFIKKGIDGRNWRNAEPYGAKLVGNFKFVESDLGYLSPGHNAAYYDEELDKMFIIFHTRFPEMGEMHSLRVHQLLMNSKGWPVIVPHRYAGETVEAYSKEEVLGVYQYINHQNDIQSTFGVSGGDIHLSENIKLNADGTISGAVEGTWEKVGDYQVNITIDGDTYYGVFLKQWDDGLKEYVMTFSALSDEGISIWGSQLPGDVKVKAKEEVVAKEPVADEDGLVAHYTFDENLEDTTGNFEQGKVIGNKITAKNGGSIDYSEGIKGEAAVFNGKSGIRLADGLIRDNNYSVAFWVNPRKITQFTTTFFGAQAANQWFSFVPNGPAEETMLWSGEDWYDAVTGMTIDAKKWSHIAITVDEGDIKVYVNGEQRFAGQDFPNVFTNAKTLFTLGVNWWDTPFKGMIDDLRIYNKSLSAEKVNSLVK